VGQGTLSYISGLIRILEPGLIFNFMSFDRSMHSNECTSSLECDRLQ